MNIETNRCTIRPFQKQDIGAFMAFRNDSQWMRYQGYKNQSKEKYEKDLLANPSFEKGAQFAVIDREGNCCIGDVYLRQENDSLWAGCTISPLKARQGYAFEILAAMIQWAKENGFASIEAQVMPENEASIALLEKSGFTDRGMTAGEKIYRLSLK